MVYDIIWKKYEGEFFVEENEARIVDEGKKSYITGIIGGLVGGFIATIPWVLMYVYGNMILAVLSIIIAIGVLKGYQLFKGKVNKSLPVIIVVISVLAITVSTFVIIPMLLLSQEGITANFDNLQTLYEYDEFMGALVKDYIVSLIFTALGISGVVANVKKQIDEGETKNIKATIADDAPNTNNLINNKNQENIAMIKDAFVKLNAMDKSTAVDKEEILSQIDNPNANAIFRGLVTQQIIVKHHKKYYFSEKNEKSLGRRFIKLYAKIMLWIIVVVFIFVAIAIGAN